VSCPRACSAATGPRLLALVTCGGRFDERTRTYESNVVVYAVATGRQGAR
jgi:hypothetical protein